MSKDKAASKISSTTKKTGKKNILPIIVVIVVIIVLIVGIIIAVISKEEHGNVVITPDNVKEVVDSLDESEKTKPGNYEIEMTTEWTFADSNSPSKDAYVKNNVSNENTVFITIELSDMGEEIYKSPYIPVGSSLTDVILDTDLSAGVYETVLTYHLVDDSNKEISTTSVAVTITIEK